MINWVKIILYLLMLIISGLSETEAAAKTADFFGIRVEDIKKRM